LDSKGRPGKENNNIADIRDTLVEAESKGQSLHICIISNSRSKKVTLVPNKVEIFSLTQLPAEVQKKVLNYPFQGGHNPIFSSLMFNSHLSHSALTNYFEGFWLQDNKPMHPFATTGIISYSGRT